MSIFNTHVVNVIYTWQVIDRAYLGLDKMERNISNGY